MTDSRNLTSTAQINLTINRQPFSYTDYNVIPAQSNPAENNQEYLNGIADQAANLGGGCGVAINKLANLIKILCIQLKDQFSNTDAGFFDFLWSEHPVYTVQKNAIKQSGDNAMISLCQQVVQESERVAQVCRR